MSIKTQLLSNTKKAIQKLGIDVIRTSKTHTYPTDFTEHIKLICDAVKPYTMTSPERVNALVNAVDYLVLNKIEGAFVECGVWKGGSAMAMLLALKQLGDEARELYLYDTFAGMSPPTSVDVSIGGGVALDKFSEKKIDGESSDWCYSSLDEVTNNVLSIGYPKEKIKFIEGKVEETIPKVIPDEIALLRLDTDWYESTKHEMIHLFPLLKQGGVLIIDDYGHWEGARKAIDEYIAENNIRILLNRIDYTGRVALKL